REGHVGLAEGTRGIAPPPISQANGQRGRGRAAGSRHARQERAVELPENLKYTDSHEWIADNGDGTVTVGITALATEQLGDLVYVELPRIGAALARGASCAVVESTKAASDVYAPVSGEGVVANADPGQPP